MNEGKSWYNFPPSRICFHDSCSRVLTDLSAKTRVMELMTHENADVRYRALLSVQQLVSHPWTTV
jgi:V-type H+-transporting ATPase subunit H